MIEFWLTQEDKYLNIVKEKAVELESYGNNIIAGVFGMVPNSLIKWLMKIKTRRIETILTTTLLISSWIIRRVQETWEELL